MVRKDACTVEDWGTELLLVQNWHKIREKTPGKPRTSLAREALEAKSRYHYFV